uniref:NADH-ubiquinone oxidoreductase chain 3 n=1 Tax=Mirax sp. QL-2014 TaxID=1491721 RepID=A0A0U1X184_9HYME|nr:NADH dehydrogenase subunit 3 [Mirax sp. QL-2014]
MFMLLILMLLFLIISMLIYLLNYLFSNLKLNLYEKNSSFECGFDPLNSSRLPFSINFYLIGVLFLVFDIEIVLILPMIDSLKLLNYLNWLFCLFLILIILYFGLEFEKKEGSLKWCF